MPLYDYQCSKCGIIFEYEVTLADIDKEVRCLNCNGSCKRLMSAPAFHLKGGGWAKDGYSKGGSKETN